MIKTTLKFVLAAGLLYFLAHRGLVSFASIREAFTDWHNMLTAFAALALAVGIGAWRWQLLISAQGIGMSWLRAMQLTLIGTFFNVALPGAVSGDFVKAFQLGDKGNDERTRALGSVVLDRVCGVTALVVVAATGVLLSGSMPSGVIFPPALRAFVLAAVLGVVAFYLYFFLLHDGHDPLLRLFRWLETRVRTFGALVRIYESLRRFRDCRGIVIFSLAISIVVQLLLATAGYCFARALGEIGLPLISFCATVPIAMLVNVFRISPAGIGTGHVAFQFMLGLAGSRHGADVFTLFALTDILFAAFGGIVFLRLNPKAVPLK